MTDHPEEMDMMRFRGQDSVPPAAKGRSRSRNAEQNVELVLEAMKNAFQPVLAITLNDGHAAKRVRKQLLKARADGRLNFREAAQRREMLYLRLAQSK